MAGLMVGAEIARLSVSANSIRPYFWRAEGLGMNKTEYAKILVTKPLYEVGRNVAVEGRPLPSMTFMSNELVPGSDTYVEFGWIWEVPEPNPLIGERTHDYDQIVDKHGLKTLDADFEGLHYFKQRGGQIIKVPEEEIQKMQKAIEPLITNWIKGMESKGYKRAEPEEQLKYIRERIAHWTKQEKDRKLESPYAQ
jgi:hypothetical protein